MSIYNCFGYCGHFHILERLGASLGRVFSAIWSEWLNGLWHYDQSALGTQLGGEIQPLPAENKGMCAVYQKRARKSSKRARLWIFIPHVSKFTALKTFHPPKQHVFLEVLIENKAFYFSKRALRVETACSKW